ncbi:MAG: HEAT repeat domain-containing protein, partial [Planctomycetota bacterium]
SVLVPGLVHFTSLAGGAAAPLMGVFLLVWSPVPVKRLLADDVGSPAARDVSASLPSSQELQRLTDLSLLPEDRLLAAERLVDEGHPSALAPLLQAISDPRPEMAQRFRELAVQLVTKSRTDCTAELLKLADGPDPEIASQAAWVLVEVRHGGALSLLVERLGDESVPILMREEILLFLTGMHSGDPPAYDPFDNPKSNRAGLEEWRRWAGGEGGAQR